MPKSSDIQPKLTLLLLREAIWQIEDRVNVIVESVADQEAAVLRLKRLNELHTKRLESLESALKSERFGRMENDG
ncbi:MAG: hypothetical protein IIB00_02900 [candidate division Zixibacteria bacterium]|nr:hypothetical protein [candidate division Zixibacteria bacterium]